MNKEQLLNINSIQTSIHNMTMRHEVWKREQKKKEYDRLFLKIKLNNVCRSSPEWMSPCHGEDHGFKSHTDG